MAASSIQPKMFDYLSSLEWIRAQQNLAIIGPAGTGESHTLIGLGTAAIHAGCKACYFTAADLVVDTLYRGLADNTVGEPRADFRALSEQSDHVDRCGGRFALSASTFWFSFRWCG